MPAFRLLPERNGFYRNGFVTARAHRIDQAIDFEQGKAMNLRMAETGIEEAADRAAAAGDYAGARALLERAVEGAGSNFELWRKLSAMCKASGDLEAALAAIDRALAISPLDFSALLARAYI